MHRPAQKVECELPHCLWPCSAEKQCLALWAFWTLLNDPPDLRLKTHVQHAISFVQHGIAHLSKPHVVLFEEFIQPPWRCNNYVASTLQPLKLLTLWLTSCDSATEDPA